MTLFLKTAPATNSVTWDELKADRRLDDIDQQPFIENDLVPAAERYVQNVSGHQLIEATYLLKLADFPSCSRIVIPLKPLKTLTHVKYYDTAGVLQTLTEGTHYRVVKPPTLGPRSDAVNRGYVELIDGQSWPSVAARSDAVEVEFVAGHGDEPEDVPGALRAAVRAKVAQLFDPHDESIPDPAGLAALCGVDV